MDKQPIIICTDGDSCTINACIAGMLAASTTWIVNSVGQCGDTRVAAGVFTTPWPKGLTATKRLGREMRIN